jgi:hypothetical protein
VNWRAAGCLVAGAVTFVAIGLIGMSLAFSDLDGCPSTLQWEERTYQAEGSPGPSPDLSALGAPGSPGEIGSTFVGLTTRQVYGPPGSSPSTRAEDRPDRIVLTCGDGTYQAYRWTQTHATPATGASPSS